MDEKAKAKELGDALLEREFVDAMRRISFENLEKIPEMRALMQQLVVERHERARIAESLGVLSYADTQRLFSEYIEEKFDVYLQKFFARLHDGILGQLRRSFSARLEILEEGILDLKRSVLMASLHPHSWVEGEIVNGCVEHLKMSPGMKDSLHALYRFVAYDLQLPTPGATLTDKYMYLLRVMRSCERFREVDGFMFELADQQLIEDTDNTASADGQRQSAAMTAMLQSFSNRKAERGG